MDIKDIINYLKNYDDEEISIMEVCGTHTASISENGIPSLISSKIHLISGPGCPVCVTVSDYIDKLIELARKGCVIVTFGDMIRVPGSELALKDIKSEGADIRMVYSPAETIKLAEKEPEKSFVFAAVGFETTTPAYALLIDEIMQKGIKNIKLLTALKTMPEVIDKVASMPNSINGFIAPGHVSVITGSNAFNHLAEKHNLPFVITGFKAEEILASIYALIKMQKQGRVLNLYKSVVKENRNEKAYLLVDKYFEPYDASWRGIGEIKGSGLVLRKEYRQYDAGSRELKKDALQNSGCKCAQIITGKAKPSECPLYAKVCTPEEPKGACMVSAEGSCFNYYINNRKQ